MESYKILKTEIEESNNTIFIACMKQIVVGEDTHDIGMHRFSVTAEQEDLSHLPTNIQERVAFIRAQITNLEA